MSTLTMTSEALGHKAGDVVTTFSAGEEAWLLSRGYAKKTGYTGVGVSNTGATAETPAQDLTAAANRELAPAYDAATGLRDPGAVDPAMTFSTADDNPNDTLHPDYDYDPAHVNNEAPGAFTLSTATGVAAGGQACTLTGQNFTGVTGVTFGGVAATSVVVVNDEKITLVTPAHAAGAVSVAVTNPVGTTTQASAFTYA